MAIIYHDRTPNIVRPTLNAFFGIGSLLALFALAFSGWMHLEDFIVAFILLPAMVLGMLIAEPFKAICSALLSRILLFLSAVSSIALILRGFDFFT